MAVLDAAPSGMMDPAASNSVPAKDPVMGNGTAVDAGTAVASQLDAAQMRAPSDAATLAKDASIQSQDGAADTGVKAPHTVKVDSKAEWTPSGFRMEAGKCYTVNAKIDDRWLDLDVEANLEGWRDKNDARIAVFAPFRRVVKADIGFYQFAACVDKKLDHCFPIGEASSVCPKLAGELFFFVNDVPGFEDNNVGTATVTLQAK